ncbi:Os05g0178850 [Oryza sativa Japonica Group]|uniref:Os05g0178850 protein n=1 Tax=Oryza sativa subsp. japonica TaxID=39947 RepID=A0A0P0WIL5_ORYSJ|nr:Os05g0178850 [Oryza sativa Japonica Group]
MVPTPLRSSMPSTCSLRTVEVLYDMAIPVKLSDRDVEASGHEGRCRRSSRPSLLRSSSGHLRPCCPLLARRLLRPPPAPLCRRCSAPPPATFADAAPSVASRPLCFEKRR